MDKLEELVRQILKGEALEIYEQTGELSYFQQVMALFSGRNGWVSVLIISVQAVMFLIGAWAAWRFFQATDMLLALKWGLSSATLLLMAGMLKFTLMPVMQGERVIRALKRVELLLVSRAGD